MPFPGKIGTAALVGVAAIATIAGLATAAPPMAIYQQTAAYPDASYSAYPSTSAVPSAPQANVTYTNSGSAPFFNFDTDGCECGPYLGDSTGTWQWMRSPDQEQRMVSALYNRYCIRCHGVDGRGVWDIPDIPNFTNVRWQQCRSDGQLARIILEGRGACMPPFRGTLSLEEAWGIARYLRTFVPGTEASRPSFDGPSVPPAVPQPGLPGAPGPGMPAPGASHR